MTVGLITAQANSWLNTLRNTASPAIAAIYVKLHTADPSAAGTNAPSAVTTRNQLTLNAASGGACTLSALAAYSMTATETITHVSVWDNPTAGTILATGVLSVSKAVNNGDTLTFNTFSVSITPIAV